jgi:hypothetical protein
LVVEIFGETTSPEMCERKCILARFRPYAEDTKKLFLRSWTIFVISMRAILLDGLMPHISSTKKAGARFRYAAATDLWRSIQRPELLLDIRNSGPKHAGALLKRRRILGRGDLSEAVDRRQRLVCKHVR